jgi:hypothetical protein
MRRILIVPLLLALTTLAFASAKVNPPGRLTAREAQQFALRKAYEWDKGCQLIMVSARPFDFGLDGRSSRWGYRCISGDGKRCAVFSFDWAHPNTPVRRGTASRPPQCQDSINDYKWKIDSPDACAIAKRSGLDAWLAKHPNFDPTYSGNRFELAADKTDGPYWLISCAAKVLGAKRKYDRIEMRISAVDGHLIAAPPNTKG